MVIYSGFTMIYPLKMVIFHSYVKLLDGLDQLIAYWSNIIQHNEAQTWQLEISKSFFFGDLNGKTHAGGQKRAWTGTVF